jgi:oxalate---CoA ligase
MRSSSAVLDAIAHYANLSPQVPAVIELDGGSFTYGQLWGWIEAASLRLIEAGITPGERVAVLLPQGALQILAVTGTMKRHIAIPLQSKTTVSEVRSLLRRLSAFALIVSPEFAPESEAAIAMGLTVLFARNGESPQDWEIRAPVSTISERPADSDACLIFITSATTGSSKMVPLTAQNLDAGIRSRRDSLRLADSDRLLLMTSLCHIIGLENALAQFLVGGSVIATRGFDPAAYLVWLYNLKPTWYDCAPAVHQAAVVQLKSERSVAPHSLRFLQSAGAPLPCEVRHELEQLLHVSVFNDYGMTEACPIAVDAFLPDGRVPNSAGRCCGLEIGIMDEAGALVPPGEEGEIVVRGDAVFHGYLDDPEANCAAFQNGWFRTGDLGRLDGEGNLYVTGRLKEMINRGGEKIAPAEVDAVLELHPAVREAASFAVPHSSLGEDVACAVVLRTAHESPVNAGDLRRFAANRLAKFKVPHRIYFVDEIPRGELGKPRRWLLAEQLSGKLTAVPEPSEPTVPKLPEYVDHTFAILHELWARILERDDLSFEEDFFEAGGDSLAAIHMLAEVDKRFGAETSAYSASFLDEPTLENLVRMVGDQQPPRPTESASSEFQVFPVRDAGTSKRLYCIPPDGQEGLIFRRLATYLYGRMDLSIVRPANSFYSEALFSIEHGGKEVANLICKAQPEGPYFLSGFCYGGVVAFEAARQLSLKGQDARLILYDVVMPGYHSLISRGRRQIKRLWHGWRGSHRQDRIESPTKPCPAQGTRARLSHIARLVSWRAMVPIRGLFVPFERVRVIQRFFHWTQTNYFPFYKARPISAPILHLLTLEEHEGFDGEARFGWRRVARRGIDERFLPLDHPNLFHESNLPTIVDILRDWCGGF